MQKIGMSVIKLNSLLCVLVVGFGLSFSALATEPSAPQDITFPVSHFTLQGELPIPAAEIQTMLSSLEGKDYGLTGLQEVSQQVEQLIRDAGFAFYRVILPPQTLANGEVFFKVVSFSLGDVEIKGNSFFDNENILSSIPELQIGSSPNTQSLSEQIKVASHHPSKDLTVVFKQSDTADEIAAKVDVSEHKPYQFSLSANNSGSAATGKARVTAAAQYSNLWNKDHIANVSYTSSPHHASDVKQYGLSYSAPLYKARGWLTGYYAKSDVNTGTIGFSNASMDVSGAGEMYGLNYLQFLPKVGSYDHSFNIAYDNRLFDNTLIFNDFINNTSQDYAQDVRSTPLTLSYKGNIPWESVYIGHHISWSKNLEIGSLNDDLAYKNSIEADGRLRDGVKSEWDVIRYGIFTNVDREGWLYRISLKGQYSNEALISGEQFGLGGAYSIRGYEEREVSTDAGNVLTLEAITPQWKGFKLIGFYDYGKGRKHNFVSTGPESKQEWNLASVGMGLRYQWQTNFQASLDLGHTLKDGPTTRAHKANLHASITLQY